jgi:hypothetical protein
MAAMVWVTHQHANPANIPLSPRQIAMQPRLVAITGKP